jgi:multiple antibiotic resistance protein
MLAKLHPSPGSSGLNVITRIMGLILAVIGVQMLVDGLNGAFRLGTG